MCFACLCKAIPTCVVRRAALPARALTASTRLACRAIQCCQEAGWLQAPYSNANQAGSRTGAPSNCGCQPLHAVVAHTARHSQGLGHSDCVCLQLPFTPAQACVSSCLRSKIRTTWECAHREAIRGGGAVPSRAARCQGGCAAHQLCVVRLGRVHADPFTKRGRALLTPPRRQGAHTAVAGSYREGMWLLGLPCCSAAPLRSLAHARASCNFTAAGAGAPPCRFRLPLHTDGLLRREPTASVRK
jgi:hypothetical protein